MAVISRYVEWLLAHARKRTAAPDGGYPCIRGGKVPENLVANLAGILPIRKKPNVSHRPSRLMRVSVPRPDAKQRWDGLRRSAIRAQGECNVSVARRPRAVAADVIGVDVALALSVMGRALLPGAVASDMGCT